MRSTNDCCRYFLHSFLMRMKLSVNRLPKLLILVFQHLGTLKKHIFWKYLSSFKEMIPVLWSLVSIKKSLKQVKMANQCSRCSCGVCPYSMKGKKRTTLRLLGSRVLTNWWSSSLPGNTKFCLISSGNLSGVNVLNSSLSLMSMSWTTSCLTVSLSSLYETLSSFMTYILKDASFEIGIPQKDSCLCTTTLNIIVSKVTSTFCLITEGNTFSLKLRNQIELSLLRKDLQLKKYNLGVF
ncbi:hypothetical protein WICPIJ_000043 [Wickerhamomyces pijperi]|uniref:Uncharacterized protein n=1 Tax=Wickerhamomyces pijperi TaxID=599730 RepID=A0A9P8TSK4_WICPI|nr:hypothetical protein WICPIJ_000043 [Wickerhamomyces pijperi]